MAKKNKSMKQDESQEISTPEDIQSNTDNQNQNQETAEKQQCNSEQQPCTSENKSPDNTVSQEPSSEQLQAALTAERDRVLRLSAEFDNYKKRSSRETADFKKFANEAVFKQLLTVVDNLERAISASSASKQSELNSSAVLQNEGQTCKTEQDKQLSALIQGVEMTYKDIIKIFETFGVKPIGSEGKPFDPVFHQAVTSQESDEYPDNTVIAEFQKGYTLHERLLRPSMVVVSQARSKQES